jgi:hypothetical protein
MLSKEVFNKVMEDLCQAYEKDIPKERAKIYYDVLKEEIDNEDMTKMLPIVLKDCKFFPSIADIMSAVRDIDYMPRLK